MLADVDGARFGVLVASGPPAARDSMDQFEKIAGRIVRIRFGVRPHRLPVSSCRGSVEKRTERIIRADLLSRRERETCLAKVFAPGSCYEAIDRVVGVV